METVTIGETAATPRGEVDDGIAVVGLAGRFPGARDVATFWKNICDGVESITVIDEPSLEDAFDPATRASEAYVRSRGILEDVDRFDAAFFGIHAREAATIDPQHRVLLETAWEALEDAGCDPAATERVVGVYVGCSIGTYVLRHVLRDRAAIERFASDYQVGSFSELLGNGNDFLATRLAYKLGLCGPAVTVQTACSTSLTAIAQAVNALRARQADVMLAGAVSITFPQSRGYVYQDGGMVSRDGHCRTFDAASSGTVFGAGAGVVVLKRLDDARADGDRIYAVVRGVGFNNDGAQKIGYSAPSIAGQAAAIAGAHRASGFDPASIDYVECHGTATPLGDPIEVAALAKAFSTSGATRCAIGSVKPNVGHLDVAAGMAGFIKTTLALYHGIIPGTLHFERLNPRIDFTNTPFYVRAETMPWPPTGSSRRAGVSAFGVGGTNVHLVLENESLASRTVPAQRPELFVLSGCTDAALARNIERFGAYLRDRPDTVLADAAWTLQTGRRAFARRRSIVAASVADAVAACASAVRDDLATGAVQSDADVAFLFPGQGSQTVGMGRELYESESTFRNAVDRCARIAHSTLGADLRTFLYPDREDEAAARALTATSIAQPAIFTTSYALVELLRSWGIDPVATTGHSVGEFVSATLAGVFTLEDAVSAVCERGRLMQAMESGAMLAVRLPEAEARAILPSELVVAAVNSPSQTVVAGPHTAIVAFQAMLSTKGVLVRRVATSHAFHSAMMEPIREPLATFIGKLTLSPPTRPYVSTVTGDWIDADRATSPQYWAEHAIRTVRFADALQTLVTSGVASLLEVGPGTALATNARQGAARGGKCTIASALGQTGGAFGETTALLRALGTLWEVGIAPDWVAVNGSREMRRLSLPAYAFEKTRHWIDASVQKASVVIEPIADETAFDARIATQGATDMVEDELAALLEDLSGERIENGDRRTTFLELGFDSLFLGRFVQAVATRFGVNVTFRQLLSDIPTIDVLAAHVERQRPIGHVSEPASAARPVAPDLPAPGAATMSSTGLEALMREQLAAMQQLVRDQLRVLGKSESLAMPSSAAQTPAPNRGIESNEAPVAAAIDTNSSRFEVLRVAPVPSSAMTTAQRAHVDSLIARVVAQTPKSKAYTQRYRSKLADPRVAAGFRSDWKEMVYPIVCDRAVGARLWDIDGNEYVDILNGFGQTAFGHAPEFVTEAVREQLDRGFAIGPQSDVAGEVAERFCRMTGNERVTFCNTGSEAVMAAMRVARTVTGRDRIVVFGGAYHGQFDEVLVKGARTSERSIPIAPGIPTLSVQNITVLKYATVETLHWIREHASELAAVIVEPVQSRHPSVQPREFLTELRQITAAAGTALVFDEVVTGFRVHPGGMQGLFDIRADLATYGKVVGGGMPIGILAGSARYMDALDGGMWSFGDDSTPEVPPTFFAGTFVRHPLVMAAVLAVLRHLEASGPALQRELSYRTSALVARLNADLEARGLASRIETFSSFFFFNFTSEERYAGLLYYHMRARGIYVQDGFPCFLTTAHGEAEVDAIVRAFVDSLDELQSAEMFTPSGVLPSTHRLPKQRFEVALTDEQTEVWIACQGGDAASCAFNESITVRLSGAFDSGAFENAWALLVTRHDALRATFAPSGETMRIDPDARIDLASLDVCSYSEVGAHGELAIWIAADARTPFDLVGGPLARAALVKLAENEHAFIFTAHHLVCDGWSINTIVTELASLYRDMLNESAVGLEVPIQFSAYASARELRDRAECEAVESYWLNRFERQPEPLALPLDRPRPASKSYAGASLSTTIDAATYASVKKAGAKNGCTLFVTLLSAFQLLLGRLAGARDVVACVPAAGQSLLQGRTLVGHCVNFLPIRSEWEAGAPIRDVLLATKTSVLEAYEHQDYTLGSLVRAKRFERERNRLPLSDVQFNLERLADDLPFLHLKARVTPNAKAFVNFDLFLNVIESETGLRLDCDYNSDLFDRVTIERWMRAYRSILDAIVSDTTTEIEAIRLDGDVVVGLAPSAKKQSIVAGKSGNYHEGAIHELFELQVAERPDARAIACGSESLTYAELDRRANRLARYLRSVVREEEGLIGITVSRSCDLVVALFATLKAGYAYVPLDPTHPASRRRGILADAGVVASIVDSAMASETAPVGVPVIDLRRDCASIANTDASPLGNRVAADASAYVIFTSGTTGVPKGVEVVHRSVVNMVTTMAREPGFGASDVLVSVTTIAFDMAAFELYVPLSVGGSVIIATNEELVDGYRLRALVEGSRSTMLQSTPATWRMLLEAGFRAPASFRMLSGGEPLQRALADRLLESSGELWNVYGPTETTVYATRTRVVREGPISIGLPLDNTQAYVLDDLGRALDRGALGELYIGGDALARGYLNAPELTARKFVPNPFHGGRMFRTGDAARMCDDGTIETFGRLDDQVKIRGFRIELGEIETALGRIAELAAATVGLHRTDESTQLVGYLVPRANVTIDVAGLEDGLRAELPEYMVPTAWVVLDTLPLSANGKVDRRALPAPQRPATSIVALVTPTERALGEIWVDVLGRVEIGRDDDIFTLGADSIQIFKIVARAHRRGIEISARDLMQKRTIGSLAAALLSPEPTAGRRLSRAPIMRSESFLSHASEVVSR